MKKILNDSKAAPISGKRAVKVEVVLLKIRIRQPAIYEINPKKLLDFIALRADD